MSREDEPLTPLERALRRRRWLVWLLVLAVLAFLVLRLVVVNQYVVAQKSEHDHFLHGSIGAETANGLPYWVFKALPVIYRDRLGDEGWCHFGLITRPGDDLPLGFSRRVVTGVERVWFNCALCHVGSYRLPSETQPHLIAGAPSNNLRLQELIQFLMAVGRDPRFTADRLMAEIDAIVALPAWERALYRLVLIPATRKALRDQAARFAWTGTRPDWGPGRIDPFNPVKFFNLGLPDDGTIGNSDMMPLWALGTALPPAGPDAALHWDGLLTDLHEIVVAGAIGDGMTRLSYPRTRDNLARMQDFIRLQAPPPSPFRSDLPPSNAYRVDPARVAAGRALYQSLCAECHEPGGRRYRQTIPAAELGTDRHRIDMWTPAARAAYSRYEPDHHWGFDAFQKQDGYVAVNLTGPWLRAPYLHNGSVPNLRALLLPPEQRPVTFWRGSDLIDPEQGGFRADPAESGWLYDTRLPGNGNGGHLWGTDLPPGQRADLVAYLKTL